MGQASEPARFPGPLFLVSLGLVAARSLGNYTESRHIKREMKAPWTNPGVRELAALSGRASLGCGLAAAQGDLLFVAIFGAASPVHSIASSARASTLGGISRPSILAVFRLVTSSYLVGACTGRSA